MRGFEIHLNGKRLCLAAVEQNEGLSVIVAYGRNKQFVDVSGSVGSEPTHPKWLETMRLNVGDELVVKVVNAAQTDPPVRVRQHEDLWPNKES